MSFQILTQLSLSTVIFLIAFLTQHLGFSTFYPNLGWRNPAVHATIQMFGVGMSFKMF